MILSRRNRRHAARRAAFGMLLAASALWPMAANALLPPYIYEGARANAVNVLILAVEKVALPRYPYGSCTVEASVAKVERGSTYAVGQKVSFAVPCAKENSLPPIGGTIYQAAERLRDSKFGRIFLNADGKVTLSQYEILEAMP